ncbi:uncharacterized protein LOC106154594 isoform X1 [Lingula anatina]|uniref:Uncharacterized protein LOC106154594 isoform X1 n=2 Tax=Lingula anatina TaxID=7574 RepID=A0A1S3HEG2_LINAN|nr:uncharacterized protein LOC106154594 isoform X1 [Lingula anatina]|eukprot:XP_013384443.1 uncharacterized protein LOC106154594 isoform X1 [Lingula anatina]
MFFYRTKMAAVFLLVMVTTSSVFVAGQDAHPPLQSIVFHSESHTWCESRPIQQILTQPGCESQSVENKVCVGQCYSYSVPNTLPSQNAGLLQRHDVCKPARARWEKVTLQCANGHMLPKFVQIIEECACASCGTSSRQTGLGTQDDSETKQYSSEDEGRDCDSCDSDIVLGVAEDSEGAPDAKTLDQLQRDFPPERTDYSLDNFLIRQAQERMVELRQIKRQENLTEADDHVDFTPDFRANVTSIRGRIRGRGLDALLGSTNVTSNRGQGKRRGLTRAARRRLLVMLERRRKQNGENDDSNDEKSVTGYEHLQRSLSRKKTL